MKNISARIESLSGLLELSFYVLVARLDSRLVLLFFGFVSRVD